MNERFFRKKPVIVMAFRFGVGDPQPEWINNHIAKGSIIVRPNFTPIESGRSGIADIRTLEGWLRADVGDWIIQGVVGEIYPCKPHIFAETYEEMKE